MKRQVLGGVIMVSLAVKLLVSQPLFAETFGALSSSQVKEVIDRNAHNIDRCYRLSYPSSSSERIQVDVTFSIGTEGKIIEAKIRDGKRIKNTHLAECIVGEVRTWVFPKPRGKYPVKVHYPFVLPTASKLPSERLAPSKKPR